MDNCVVYFEGHEIPVTITTKGLNPRVEIKGKYGLFEIISTPLADREWVEKFLNERRGWIDAHFKKHEKLIKLVESEIERDGYYLRNHTKMELRNIIKDCVYQWEHMFGKANRISIRNDLKGKWATCSSKNNMTFDIIMSYLPIHLIRYIVYHEMCHFIEKNHGSDFYKLMEFEYPDYKEYDHELDIYYYLITRKEHREKVEEYNTLQNVVGIESDVEQVVD